ncbi:MAG: fibronectin type III domain-containing protein, partial [Chloroflexi bacterium]|nr:fibronectin type III domain-containing protein [Chloroflexota bacterium]
MALVGMVLALGAGQAAAQISVDDPPTSLTEGDATTITVDFEGQIAASSASPSVVILRAVATNATVVPANGLMEVTVPANSAATAAAFAKQTRTFTVTPSEDDDAASSNNQPVTVTFTLVDAGTLTTDGTTAVEAPAELSSISVDDDETQSYALTLLTRDENLVEAKAIQYRVSAVPAFVSGATAVPVDLRLTPALTISGTVVSGSNTTAGEAQVEITDTVNPEISFTVPKDEDSADTQITLTANWGTRLDGGTISDSRTIVDPDDPAPSALGAPTLTATPGNNEVTLTWMSVTGATKYQYAYGRTGSTMGDWMPEAGMATMSATVANLTNGMEYTFYVRAGNDAGYGEEAGMATATPMAAVEVPGVPTNLTATAGDGQVMLSWNAPTGGGQPTGYQYQYGAGNLMSAWMPETPQTGMTATVTGLINGTTYMFKVRAVNAAGPGLATDPVEATAASTTPPTGGSGEGKYTLTANRSSTSTTMTEGQSLVPVSVRYTVPAAASGTRSATVTVTVSVLQRAATSTDGLTVARERIYESEVTPVTRAELGSATAGVVNEVVALSTTTDVEWLTDPSRDDGDIVYTNAVAGQAFFVFDYGEGAFDETHTAYLRTNRDTDAEDELFKLAATDTEAKVTPSRTGADKVLVRIDDVQTQLYELDFPGNNPPHKIDEGDPAGLELAPVPPRTVEMPFNVTLASEVNDVADYSLDDNPAAISQNYTSVPGTLAGRVPFTVNTSTNDGDRKDDTVTVTARTTELTGSQRVLETLDIEVLDLHLLPSITLTKVEIPDAENKLQEAAKTADGNYIIPEGKVGTVTLTADRGPRGVPLRRLPDSEAITVTLSYGDDSTADEQDYSLDGNEVKFTATGTTATFKVDVDADEDVREEALVLGAMVEGVKAIYGENPSEKDPHETLAAIVFGDETDKEIEAKSYAEIEAARDTARTAGAGSNGRWEPGEELTLAAEDLFEYASTANVVLGNIVVEDPAILSAAASNDTVTVTAVGDGESPISITATVLPASSSLEVTQTTSTVATIKFPIMVDAPMITAKDNIQAVADAAVVKAAAASANKIWEPAPNGETAMIALSDLFDVPASIEPRYLAEASTGAVDADVVSSTMMLELEPEKAGMDKITVTAVDTERPGNAVSVEFDVEVVEQASLRAKSQTEVDKVFMDAGADALVAGGDAVMVNMSMLYEIADEVKPTYTATSDMPSVLEASTSGMMLTLAPMSAGSAMVMVEAVDSASKSIVAVMYDATVARADTTYTVTASEMSVMEGGDAVTITATAKQEVLAETMIELQYAGTSASEDDYSLEPKMITIAAGGTVGTTMLTATDDDE